MRQQLLPLRRQLSRQLNLQLELGDFGPELLIGHAVDVIRVGEAHVRARQFRMDVRRRSSWIQMWCLLPEVAAIGHVGEFPHHGRPEHLIRQISFKNQE